MPDIPRYTFSILELVGNSRIGPEDFEKYLTIWLLIVVVLILSCFLVYQQRWRHVLSLNAWCVQTVFCWWWEIDWFHSIIACHLARVVQDFPDMVFGICLHRPWSGLFIRIPAPCNYVVQSPNITQPNKFFPLPSCFEPNFFFCHHITDIFTQYTPWNLRSWSSIDPDFFGFHIMIYYAY